MMWRKIRGKRQRDWWDLSRDLKPRRKILRRFIGGSSALAREYGNYDRS
jgi:hypothetical protein